MTEQEWLTSEDPAKMLDFATYQEHSNRWHHAAVSERKLRLFACTITRSMVLPSDMVGIAAIEDAADWRSYDWSEPPAIPLGGGSYWCAEPDVRRGLEELLCAGTSVKNRAALASLLRDIVGNPFRPLALESAYLEDARTQDAIIATRRHGEKSVRSRLLPGTWLTPTVLSLAQAAYQERMPDGTLDTARLAVLSDALEEAGCPPTLSHEGSLGPKWLCTACELRCELKNTFVQGNLRQSYSCPNHGWRSDAGLKGTRTVHEPHPLLAHLRSPGPHVRGCWALDLILRKE